MKNAPKYQVYSRNKQWKAYQIRFSFRNVLERLLSAIVHGLTFRAKMVCFIWHGVYSMGFITGMTNTDFFPVIQKYSIKVLDLRIITGTLLISTPFEISLLWPFSAFWLALLLMERSFSQSHWLLSFSKSIVWQIQEQDKLTRRGNFYRNPLVVKLKLKFL